ncbi:TonB-dependent receptor [Niveispirillum fermenti]|uniref:TonB-dependent receptor n=1 Tax=Niveispirillum fermenti TaxID=1233113 RepID=UPI003A89AB51
MSRKYALGFYLGGVAAIALATALPAQAQEAPAPAAGGEQTLDEIIVTGFRASLASALQTKRNANEIIESITAEDMGKFPDQNIAESLQRLSGVQIDRNNGQGTRVRIRGLDQNVTLLNEEIFLTGLEVFTLGEGQTREVDSLEGVPSELLGGVDVYKSPNARLLEGGLGGTINLKTRNPLVLDPGYTVAGNVRAAKSTGADGGWKPLGAVAFGYNWDDKAAFIGTFSYDKQNSQTDVLGGQNRGNWRFAERGDKATVPTNYYAPEYRYATDRNQTRERIGGSLSGAVVLSDSVELSGEWFHSELDILTSEASLKFPFAIESPGLDATKPYSIDGNGVLLNGTLIANSAEAISYVQNSSVKADNFGLKLKFDDGGNFRGSVRGAYAKADLFSDSANNDVRYTSYGVPTADPTSPTGFSHQPANPAAPSNYLFSYNNGNGKLPSFSLPGIPDLYTNPAYGFFKSHWVFGDRADLENYSLRADGEYEPEFIGAGNVTLSGGYRFASRDVDYSRGRYLADYSGKGELDGTKFGQKWTPYGYFQDGAIGYKSCELPAGTPGIPAGCTNRFGNSPPLITPFQTFTNAGGRVETINNFFSSGDMVGGKILVQDRGQMKNGAKWIQALYPDTPFAYYEEPLESFRVKEETHSGYMMADVGDAGDGYHINVGARLIHTTLTVYQNRATDPDPVYLGTDSWNGVLRDSETIANERSYTDILPSLNMVFDLDEGQKVRFAASRVVARQNLFDLGRGFRVDFTRNPTTDLFEATNGSAGNPDLDPFRASQFDVGYEYYFGTQGLVSAVGFWKEVDSFIGTETKPEFVMDQAGGRNVPIQRPINGDGGRIKGFELSGQYAFDWGVGFNVNYTYSDSKSPLFNDFDTGLPIPGVSKHAFNGQLYYEDHGLEARVSYTWRSKSFSGNFGFGDGAVNRTLGIWNRSYGQLDAQIGYQVTEQIGLTLEGINLTKEDQSQYLQFNNLPFTYASGSQRIMAGVRFKLGG